MAHNFLIFIVILLVCPSFSFGSETPSLPPDNSKFQKEFAILTDTEHTIQQFTDNLAAFNATLDNQDKAAQLVKDARKKAQEIKASLSELSW